MTSLLKYEDFSIGQEFTLGPYTVTADEIIEFAREFDPQPQHLSEEGGRASILGGLAASGFHVTAIAMRMLVDAVFSHYDILGGIGCEELRWMKPVRPNDVLSGIAKVKAVRVSAKDPTRGYVTTWLEISRPKADGTREAVLRLDNTAIFATRAH